MDALVAAGNIILPSKEQFETIIHSIAKDLSEDETTTTLLQSKPCSISVNELKSTTDIEPPSIEPLENFLEKRAITIDTLRKLRKSMEKHVFNCKISSTVGNSASIIGGVLCFFFPIIGVPVLLTGSATTLGTTITGNVLEKRLRKKYTHILEEDSLAMQVCESNLKDITTWLVTVYSLGYSVSKAGVDFLQLAESIQAASTLGAWSNLIGQLPTLSSAIATGAQTASTISGQLLGVSVIISVADLIQTWVSKNNALEAIDKDIDLLEQQLNELKRIAEIYKS
mgnify:CR=1 FL=1